MQSSSSAAHPLVSIAGFLLLTATTASSAVARETAADVPERTIAYSIIVTGHELLNGVYADGHTIFLTKTLRPLGLQCVGSLSVDDEPRDIRDALEFASQRSELVIVTGGLGPTASDVTRDVLAEFTDNALREQTDLVRQLAKEQGVARDRLRGNLRRQTRVPLRGTYLPNEKGTAVGLVFEQSTHNRDQVVVALPGPPSELQPMVKKHLIPYLASRFGVHTLGSSLTLRFVGIGQSRIDQVIEDHIELPQDVMQTSQFHGARVDFTFTLPGDSRFDHKRLQTLNRDMHAHLESYIYADDPNTNLEEATLAEFARRGQTISVAEIGSGGALASGLSTADARHDTFLGAFIAPSPTSMASLLELPAESCALETADDPFKPLTLIGRRTREQIGSDWTFVVGAAEASESEAGAKETGRLPVLLLGPRDFISRRSVPPPPRSSAALERLTTHLLDIVRRAAAQQ